MAGEKTKIELATSLSGAPDRRLQNRKWAKTDVMTSAFAHYRDVARRGRTGLMNLSFFQNVEFMPVLERTQPTGNIKNRHEIVI